MELSSFEKELRDAGFNVLNIGPILLAQVQFFLPVTKGVNVDEMKAQVGAILDQFKRITDGIPEVQAQ